MIKKEKNDIPVSKYLIVAIFIEVIIGVIAASTFIWTNEVISLITGFIAVYFIPLTFLIENIRGESQREIKTSLTNFEKKIDALSSRINKIENTTRSKIVDILLTHGKCLDDIKSGRFEITENSAVELMKELAESADFEIIATSYYDVECWAKATITQRVFWPRYIEILYTFLDKKLLRLKEIIKDDKLLEKHLKENPIMRRTFIIDIQKNDENWPVRWSNIKNGISSHRNKPGYDVRGVSKSAIYGKKNLIVSEPDRVAEVHDFVMFDRKVVVEIVQVGSLWEKDFLNTYGIVYVDPLVRGKKTWTEEFRKYFEFINTHAIPIEELINEIETSK